ALRAGGLGLARGADGFLLWRRQPPGRDRPRAAADRHCLLPEPGGTQRAADAPPLRCRRSLFAVERLSDRHRSGGGRGGVSASAELISSATLHSAFCIRMTPHAAPALRG